MERDIKLKNIWTFTGLRKKFQQPQKLIAYESSRSESLDHPRSGPPSDTLLLPFSTAPFRQISGNNGMKNQSLVTMVRIFMIIHIST